MKNLKDIIQEKLVITKDTKLKYTCHPKDWYELTDIIGERLKKDKNADLNDIDVSKITDMSGLFIGLDPHNIKIDKWDVSKVTNMSYMFSRCENFEGKGLENWNVNNVKYMQNMFYDCKNFNCDLSKWILNNKAIIHNMFDGCTSLKNKPSWYKE